MYNFERLAKAIKLGCKAHAGDKWGEYPYPVHLSLVALEGRKIDSENDDLEAAAWLHDVIEDHPEYADEVKEGFPELYESILIVSRKGDETYNEFIDRILGSYDELAITLKLADMTVNLGDNPREGLRKRYEKNISRLQKRVQSFYQS